MSTAEWNNWVPVCRYEELRPEEGAAALIAGIQVAIFRTHDGSIYATGNQDPFSGANVLARGIVGTRKGIPTVASPLHKQVFSLMTGECLDDVEVAVPVFAVRCENDVIEVSVT